MGCGSRTGGDHGSLQSQADWSQDHCDGDSSGSSGCNREEKSATLLLALSREWADSIGTEDQPLVLLGGDFNSTPDGPAYKTLTTPGAGMQDISGRVPDALLYGNREFTYTSFGEPGETPKKD